MDLNALLIFVAVAEHESFSDAARALGLAKSTASARVRALEKELGVQLLVRTTRQLSLTEAGEALYERGRDIVSTAAEAEQAVSELRESPIGALRISAPVPFGRRFLGGVLAELLSAHPGLKIRVDLADRDVDLVAERYDVAVRIGQLEASSLVVRRVGTSRSCVVGAPRYLNLRGRPKTPDDLDDHECLRFAHQRMPDTWRFDGPDGPRDVRVSGRLVADNGDVLASTAAAGLGLAWLPDVIADPWIADGRLEKVLMDHCRSESPIHLVFPARRHRLLKVRLFADALEAALAERG